MESLFTTLIAILIFFILIIKFASSAKKLNSKTLQTNTISKRKTNKKVRFADEFVVNKLTTDPSQSESFQENVGSCEYILDELVKEKEGLISEEDDSDNDDDWEGVERTDLQKLFLAAPNFDKVDHNFRNVDHDVKMDLYGLYKVATEGPCRERQPIALNVSARAKWNAWQKLGNMNPDVAMEQYISLLSEKIPGWSQGNHNTVDKN